MNTRELLKELDNAANGGRGQRRLFKDAADRIRQILRRQGHDNFHGSEGANGGCFFEIGPGEKKEHVYLKVGYSCCIVHDGEVPVTWLSEVIAIATEGPGKMAGFLKSHYGEGGYALQCDPAPPEAPTTQRVYPYL